MKAGNFSGLALPLGAVGVFVGLAQGDILTLNAQLEQESSAQIGFLGGEISDERQGRLDVDFDDDTGLDFAWSQSQVTRAALGGQHAHIETNASLSTSATQAVFGLDFSSVVGLPEPGEDDFSQVSHRSVMSMTMLFDRHSEVEVYMRIEYDEGTFGDIDAMMRIEGFEDMPGVYTLEAHDPRLAGVMELTVRGVVNSRRVLSFDAVLENFMGLDPMDGTSRDHMFSLTSIVTVVPAPGGTLMLGGLGLLASRRRR